MVFAKLGNEALSERTTEAALPEFNLIIELDPSQMQRVAGGVDGESMNIKHESEIHL